MRRAPPPFPFPQRTSSPPLIFLQSLHPPTRWTTPANTFSGSQLQEFAQAFAENAALGGTAMPRSDSGQCTSTYLTYNTDAQPLEINITVSFQSSSIDSGTYVTVVPVRSSMDEGRAKRQFSCLPCFECRMPAKAFQ